MKTVTASALKPLTKQCEAVAQLLKALAHPQRLLILCTLLGTEKTVTELQEFSESSQSHISQFLSRMKAEGWVSSRRGGQFVYYRISDPTVEKVIQALGKIFCP